MFGSLKKSLSQRVSNVASNAANAASNATNTAINVTGRMMNVAGHTLQNGSERLGHGWNKVGDNVQMELNHGKLFSNPAGWALAAATYVPTAIAVNVAKGVIGSAGRGMAKVGTSIASPSDNKVSRFLENKSNQIKTNSNKLIELEKIRQIEHRKKVNLMREEKELREKEEELRKQEERRRRGYYGGRKSRRNRTRKNKKTKKSRHNRH